jgi:hypothetical protein
VNNGGFALDLERFATGASARVEGIRRAVVLKLFSAVIKDTPVLTGRLRSNWQTSVGSPMLGELPMRGEGAALGEVTAAAAAVHGDQPVFLRNNLPYGPRIEFDGWSHTKAPEGMLRKNVARFQRLVNEQSRGGKL